MRPILALVICTVATAAHADPRLLNFYLGRARTPAQSVNQYNHELALGLHSTHPPTKAEHQAWLQRQGQLHKEQQMRARNPR